MTHIVPILCLILFIGFIELKLKKEFDEIRDEFDKIKKQINNNRELINKFINEP